jgi:hypothetical protein
VILSVCTIHLSCNVSVDGIGNMIHGIDKSSKRLALMMTYVFIKVVLGETEHIKSLDPAQRYFYKI